jgi:hypothetical protein
MSLHATEGIRAVTVPLVTAPNGVQVVTAPCRLCGWCLNASNINSLQVQGAVVAPAAFANIAQITGVPAGEYHCSWTVGLSGPAAAADQNNFRLTVGATVIANSNNLPAAGEYPQNDVNLVVPAGGATVKITNPVAGTAGVVYDASFSLSTGPICEVNIQDSGQVLGVSAIDTGKSDTQMLSDSGIYVSSFLQVVALAGTVSGVLYVRDYRDAVESDY